MCTRSSRAPGVTAVTLVRMLRCIFPSAIFAFERYMLRSRGLGLAFQFGQHCVDENDAESVQQSHFRMFHVRQHVLKPSLNHSQFTPSLNHSHCDNKREISFLIESVSWIWRVNRHFKTFYVENQNSRNPRTLVFSFDCMPPFSLSEYDIQVLCFIPAGAVLGEVPSPWLILCFCTTACNKHLLCLKQRQILVRLISARRRDAMLFKLLTSNMPECMQKEFPTPLPTNVWFQMAQKIPTTIAHVYLFKALSRSINQK